jgi:hypothetical protein
MTSNVTRERHERVACNFAHLLETLAAVSEVSFLPLYPTAQVAGRECVFLHVNFALHGLSLRTNVSHIC